MESLLAHPGPAINPQASENPPGTEVTPFQVTDVEPSTQSCASRVPCPRAIHPCCPCGAVRPLPSTALCCSHRSGPSRARWGTAGQGRLPGALARRGPSVLLCSIPTSCLESCSCISCGPRGTWVGQAPLGEVASPSAEGPAMQRWRPSTPPPARGVRACAPRVCHVCVSMVCPPAAPCMPRLVCVTC